MYVCLFVWEWCFCRCGFLGARLALRLCHGAFLGARLALRLCRGNSLGARPALWFGCGNLFSVRGLAFLLQWFPRRASGDAALLRRFALGARPAMRFYCGFLSRFTPVFFPLSGKKRRLAIPCVSIPPGRDRHSCVLAALLGYLHLWVHFGFGRLFVAISTGVPGTRGTGYGRTGLAARPLCAFARARWLCCAFRGEYAGAARPRLRQRVFDSLDSLHAAAGLP